MDDVPEKEPLPLEVWAERVGANLRDVLAEGLPALEADEEQAVVLDSTSGFGPEAVTVVTARGAVTYGGAPVYRPRHRGTPYQHSEEWPKYGTGGRHRAQG